MKRRQLLGAAAAGIGLAGISAGAYAESIAAQSDEDDERAVLDIVDHELVAREDGETYLAATVENTGEVASGWVTLEAEWFDEAAASLDTDLAHLGMLGAGRTWLARVYYDGPEDATVADFTLSGRADYEPLTVPEGLAVVDHDIEIGEEEVLVAGGVENETGELRDTADVIALFYDGDARVLGDAWTTLTDLPNGESQSFEVSWNARDRAAAVDDYTVFVTGSAFGEASQS